MSTEKDNPIGPSDIAHMEKTIINGSKINRVDRVWIKAFREYNQQAEKKLRTTCPACYYKVLKHHIDKNKDEE